MSSNDIYKKRALDLILALLLVPFALLACILASLVIGIEDRGNPLFIQERVGARGRTFKLLKLRTMRTGTGDRPSHETVAGSITRVGGLLRKSKIDELPQLWNVLVGHMSFIGPRPGLPSQTLLITERRKHGVDALLPGITGVSQVAGLDMSQPEKLAEMDARYLEPWSLRRDLWLLWRTAMGGGRGDAALGDVR